MSSRPIAYMRLRRLPWLIGAAALAGGWAAGGCGTGPILLPFAQIQATQQFDQPNFTVRYSVAGAVSDPSAVQSVNWVFGDAVGFVTGGVEIDYRYGSTGTYDVTAYIFGPSGSIGTLNLRFTVFAGESATGPSPADAATGASIDPTLTWTAGAGSPMHDVYFGLSATTVAAATTASDEYQGRRSDASFTPSTLAAGTTYYWRIDEVVGAKTTKGFVWSFTTAALPDPVASPSPVNGATGVSLNADLSWTASASVASFDVFFGTSADAVSSADRDSDEFRGNRTQKSFDPGLLEPGVDHFWRIDGRNSAGVTTGGVFSFRTADEPNKIFNAFPVDGATNVPIDVELSWTAGAGADSHNVYFGTDENAVRDATPSSATFRGNQPEMIFKPAGVAANVNYYWRIDEVGAGGTTKGDVLRFRTSQAPGLITDPEPANNEVGVNAAPTLTWTASERTSSYDVYFGDDLNAVTDANTNNLVFRGNQTDTQYTPAGPLEDATEYFWRVDANGPGGRTKGNVLRFTTIDARAARDPNPAHEAADVSTNQALTWTAGSGAESHDVYFGTTQTGVTNATRTSGEFAGNFPSAMFTPALQPGVEYFWRVDEVIGDETIKGATWSFSTAPTPPEKADTPNPSDGAIDFGVVTPTLSWAFGLRALSHDVYFGTDMAAVAAADRNSPLFRGNRAAITYSPGPLDRATTYYWRIDEVNDGGTTTGDVWSFTTVPDMPTKATAPMPVNGATDLNVNAPVASVTMLSWTAGTGMGTITHDVYFGTSMTAVNNATGGSPEYKGVRATANYDPGTMSPATDYFWRIDEKNSGGTRKGDVWMFRTSIAAGLAVTPSPANDAVGVSLTPTLMWTAGGGATSHDVYFGTSQSAVDSANRQSAPQYRTNLAMGTTTFTGPFGVTLMGDTQYYWRIDEVSNGGISKGTVWSFRTAPQAPAQPTAPNPSNGQTMVSTSSMLLNWTAASGATEYRLYYGTDQMLVTNKDMTVDQGTTMSPSFNTGLRVANTTYYWRVVATNSIGSTDGPVWSFTTAP